MRKFLLPLAFIFCVISVKAQVEISEDQPYNGINRFYEEILNFSSEKSGTTRIDVYLQIPFTSIQFIKSGDSFTGSYTATVSIFDKDENALVEEKTWTENLKANNFDATILKDNHNLSLRSFILPPGNYIIRTSIDDKNSQRNFASKNKFHVRDLSGSLAMSDILLINKFSTEGGKKTIIPNISRNVADIKHGLPFFFEIYSHFPQKVDIDYTVTDDKNNLIYHEDQFEDLDSGKTQIFHVIHDSSFSLGNYNLIINLKDQQNKLLASTKKPFFSQWAGIPATVRDLNKAIDELVYIASPSEIDSMKEAKTKEERLKIYLEFWKRQDPTPNTDDNPVFDEYYRRVAYANANFAQYIEGWRSDRGMVYILLGPPNSVDRHPFDIDSKPYVVWQYYNLNRSFVFIDETGFGDYRLVTPLTGDLYRFRYH